MMNHEGNHPIDQPDGAPPSLLSPEEVVRRLERLWNSQAPSSLTASGSHVHGLKFARYELQQIRGQGAFGVVYQAIDTALNRQVALKIPREQALLDRDKRARFEAEAAAAALLDHPGIITVYEAELAGPTPYIATAFCPGPDLGEWLQRRKASVAWSDASNFVAQLADAVQYAHDRGVYHRDIKPSNVLLMPVRDCPHFTNEAGQTTEPHSLSKTDANAHSGEMGTVPLPPLPGALTDYQPKLADFGLAKTTQLTAAETRSSLLLGTPLYMAPEQLESGALPSPAIADVYSLGCILYELITGQPPIQGDSYAEMLDRLRDQQPLPLRRLRPEVPRDLETVCAKCLEKNPAARYQSAAALAVDLRACVEGTRIQARGSSLLTRLKYWCTRPQRIRDAGWYTFCVQILLMIWVGIALVVGCYLLSIPTNEMLSMIVESVVLFTLVNGPMAVAGWYTIRQRPWAIYAGLFLSIFNVVVPLVFMALSIKPFFEGLYARVDSRSYHAFAICSLIFFAEAGQIVLYAVAIAAWRRLQRNRQ